MNRGFEYVVILLVGDVLLFELFYVCFMNEVLFEFSGCLVIILVIVIVGGLFLLIVFVWFVFRIKGEIVRWVEVDFVVIEWIYELEFYLV